MKWVFPAAVSVVLPLAVYFSGTIRSPLLVLCVLSLQADYTLFLGDWSAKSWAGLSGPSGLFVPFGTLACVVFLAYDRLLGLDPVRPRFAWTQASVTVPFIALMVSAAATVLYTPEPIRAVYYLQTPVYLYLFFLIGRNATRSQEDVALIMGCLMVTLGVQALVYFTQSAVGVSFDLRGELVAKSTTNWAVPRHSGTVGTTPAGFASFMMPLSLIAVSRFLVSTNARERRRPAWLAMMGVVAALLTFTRAAWIGLALGLLVLTLLTIKRGGLARMTAILIVVCLSAAMLWPKILLRSSDYQDQSGLEERVALMRMAWRVIKDNPVLGVGAGAYSFTFRRYLTAAEEQSWLHVVHNTYLLQWAETGLLGLLGLVTLWCLAVRTGVRASRASDPMTRALGLGCTAGFTALMWEMLWDMDLGFQVNGLVWFLVGVTSAAIRVTKDATIPATPAGSPVVLHASAPRLLWQPR